MVDVRVRRRSKGKFGDRNMSLKLPLDLGYFDSDTGQLLPLRVDATAVREAIVRAGGRLPEQCSQEDRQRLWIATD